MKRPTSACASSDTEFQDGDLLVPNVEASLDNSKTISYCGGSPALQASTTGQPKDREHWTIFKQDIVRLTHTLRIKGWRQVPIENCADIDVERLSGALTNAVYVVSPPRNLPDPGPSHPENSHRALTRKPLKLLLRVYGPQVEHLIDRDAELNILRRLGRKQIGPRLLGTFKNGRFEEFFNARTLTAEDLRVPETSKQIAKRMRELHDGIELLEAERDAGPAVFVNWHKWVDRCEKVITWLDRQVTNSESSETKSRYAKRGLVCGVEWPIFRKAVEKATEHIYRECGGKSKIRQNLVFAHNDAQYGNLMRLKPSGESPLLLPSNEHKQLVVIDFEYAGANLPGLEFANHFTEWCYNYHHPELNYACNTNAYPTAQEQHRFIRSYVRHRPQFHPAASATPKIEARDKTNISDFMLDVRTPQGPTSIDYEQEEREREAAMERDIQRLMRETRLWRVANSAQWVAWGIVQAKVPELDEAPAKSKIATVIDKAKGRLQALSDPLDSDVEHMKKDARHGRREGRAQDEAQKEGDSEDENEFDYLSYAQERAMLFWGDCLQMGLVHEDELPEGLKARIKIVRY